MLPFGIIKLKYIDALKVRNAYIINAIKTTQRYIEMTVICDALRTWNLTIKFENYTSVLPAIHVLPEYLPYLIRHLTTSTFDTV